MWRKKISVLLDDGTSQIIDVTTLHEYDPRPVYGCDEPREHIGCGGVVVDYEDYYFNADGDEFNTYYRCEKCGETFVEPREWMEA